MELYQIVLLVVGALLLILIGLAYLYKKNYLKYSKLITPILDALNSVLKAVGNIFPANNVLNTITTVISASIEATGYAENLWLQGEIDKSMRPKYAMEYINTLLKRAGIEVTDSITTIIDGIIAITCYLMPHYSIQEEKEE